MAVDGHIIFKTSADNSQLEKDLAKATKDVERLEKQVGKTESDRAPIVEQLRAAQKEAEAAYTTVEKLQKELAASQTLTSQDSSTPITPEQYVEEITRQKEIGAELTQQEKILKQKEAAAEKLEAKDASIVSKLERQTAELDSAKSAAADLSQQMEQAGKATPLNNMMDGVNERIDKLGKRITSLAKRVFVFTMITAALRGMRTWLGNVIQGNDEASAALARLKGALLTLAQPLVEYIIPAFVSFCNILTRVVTAVASLLSGLFGKTLSQSQAAAEALNNEQKALNGVGSAAKKNSKFLAGFDEINQVQEDTSSGGSASGSASPSFDFDTSGAEKDLSNLLHWIELIGAALLYWKLPKGLKNGWKTFLGILMAIHGAITMIQGAWDAWQNGMDKGNLLKMLEGAAFLVGGLALAFGTVGAAIGLIVSGITFLVSGFHDATENGWNLYNLLSSVMGILAIGAGIALFTGSWIPLLIAGIASVLLALTVATGHGEELIDGIKQVFQGFLTFIKGVFTGDLGMALQGIEQMFAGLKTTVFAVFDGVRDTILSFLDWLDEKTGGKLHFIIENVKEFVTGFFDGLKESFGNMIDDVKSIFSGLVKFVSGVLSGDWNRAWEGIKSIFKGVWNGIVDIGEAALNALVKGINGIGFGPVPDWVPLIGGKDFHLNVRRISLPRLASGAVIPPNNEFMAVLGDQSSGNNLEAPEGLIRKIVREEAGGNAQTVVLLQAILEAVKDGKILMVDKRVLGKVTSEALNNAARASGTAVISV